MAVTGKSGKISGKGGKIAAKRHKKPNSSESMTNISKPSLRRLARRAGIKRLSADTLAPMQQIATSYLTTILQKATSYADHAKRKTITVNDIIYSLKDSNVQMMGF